MFPISLSEITMTENSLARLWGKEGPRNRVRETAHSVGDPFP